MSEILKQAEVQKQHIPEGKIDDFVAENFSNDLSEENNGFEGLISGMAFLQSLSRLIKAKYADGFVLLEKKGAKWTWLTHGGKTVEEIIPYYREKKDFLKSALIEEIDTSDEHQRIDEEKKRDRERGIAMRKQQERLRAVEIDRASEKIAEIYADIVDLHDLDEVMELDQERIDKLLMGGYTEVGELFDKDDELTGFILMNPINGKEEEEFNVILPVKVSEEEDCLNSIGLNDKKMEILKSFKARPVVSEDGSVSLQSRSSIYHLPAGFSVGKVKPSSEFPDAVEVEILDQKGNFARTNFLGP